jgi:putative transposase
MKYNPQIHHRRSIRLKNYDYRQAGAYFITICTLDRECLFGEIRDGQNRLNQYGKLVEEAWNYLPNHFPSIELDSAVIMPNHFHGILLILPARSETENRPTLGNIIAYFKYQSTKQIDRIRQLPNQKIWQRNYYEHIVRTEETLEKLRRYIENNPQKWHEDGLHPQNPSRW